MRVTNKDVYHNLELIFEESPEEELNKSDKWVIFSDLHMGDGSTTDDFQSNSEIFAEALEGYYLKKKFKLFLNGDVEELQRFPLKKITTYWKKIYTLFDQFHEKTDLIKTIGNHDIELGLMKDYPFPYRTLEGFKLRWKGNPIFLFHGHQASKKYQKHNELIGFTLKYLANPLGIKSYSVSHDSKKQYNIEKRVYHYSSFNERVSIIGHTHRPLFESLHKVERLRFKIEQLCRDYAEQKEEDKKEIKATIKTHKKELKTYYKEHMNTSFQSYVYNSLFHIPCLFNSGTVIGKRGMTCLELDDGQIRLVHWFDKNISKKYLQKTGYQSEQLDGTNYYRMVINQEQLDYVFTRIKLLS